MKQCRAILLLWAFCTLITTGCQRQATDMWDDARTAGRYMGRGVRSLGGKHGDSRQVMSKEAFAANNSYQNDFIPLYDEEQQNTLSFSEPEVIPQSRENPGDPGSAIPGIDAFTDPAIHAELAALFRNIEFPYNSELVKGRENIEAVQKIAAFLKKHPNTYIFIEGHCDERGPQAYNLALGSRRANAVRTMLIKEGVNLDNIFTISYGKERPIASGEGEGIRSKNRRAQFKVYQQ